MPSIEAKKKCSIRNYGTRLKLQQALIQNFHGNKSIKKERNINNYFDDKARTKKVKSKSTCKLRLDQEIEPPGPKEAVYLDGLHDLRKDLLFDKNYNHYK